MIKLGTLVESITNESTASEEAKKMGLTHAGWGRYKDSSGKITHKSVDNKLVKIGGSDPVADPTPRTDRPQRRRTKTAKKASVATTKIAVNQADTKPDPSFDELRAVAKQHRNVIMTEKPLTALNFPSGGVPQRMGVAGKPEGLWYGIGSSWVDWTSYEMPGWKGNNLYSVEIDYSNVLVLDTIEKMKKFERQYKKQNQYGLKSIDWTEVSAKYDGIEIPIYQSSMRFTDWYYPWDVASGCIWNPKAIKNVVQLPIT